MADRSHSPEGSREDLGHLTASPAIALRDYQEAIIAGARTEMRDKRRVLIVSPTGSGKTIVFSQIVSGARRKGKRVVITAHRQEIIDQISRALDRLGVSHGVIAPGRVMTDDTVQVAMVQSLARHLDSISEPDLLIIDEAHHGVAGQWRKVTDAWQRARILGVTATPERLDGRGLGDAFDAMVLGPSVADLIARGHLATYDYYAPPLSVSLSDVSTRGGEFASDELAAIMDQAKITGDAIEHYREALNGRPAIAFCVNRLHAEHVAAQFRDAGYRAAAIDGTMKARVREDLIASLADGRLDLLSSCELISEGVDVPVCSGAILLRPTKSLALHLQQVGRVLRPKPDGSRAVILDHVGNVHVHGLPDAPRDWSLEGRKKRKVEQGVSTCSLCFRTVPAADARGIGAACPGDAGEPCPLAVSGGGAKVEPEVVEGKLARIEDPLAWAQGIDLARARGPDWFRLVDLADCYEKAMQIQRARGYRRGWARHFIGERLRIHTHVDMILRNGALELLDAPDDVLWALARKLSSEPARDPDLLRATRAELFRRRERAA